MTLTAQSHHPRASTSPSVQWGYCVRVTTVAGTSVASKIDLRIVSGRMTVARAGEVWLKKGYDHWCGSIGGEASLFNAVPHGKRLEFRAIVTANGGTVTRDWPIVVR